MGCVGTGSFVRAKRARSGTGGALTDQQDQFVQQIRTNAEQLIAFSNQLFEQRKVQITEEGEK